MPKEKKRKVFLYQVTNGKNHLGIRIAVYLETKL